MKTGINTRYQINNPYQLKEIWLPFFSTPYFTLGNMIADKLVIRFLASNAQNNHKTNLRKKCILPYICQFTISVHIRTTDPFLESMHKPPLDKQKESMFLPFLLAIYFRPQNITSHIKPEIVLAFFTQKKRIGEMGVIPRLVIFMYKRG
jgi:hypothetical protein